MRWRKSPVGVVRLKMIVYGSGIRMPEIDLPFPASKPRIGL
jgi:hypothetical protein